MDSPPKRRPVHVLNQKEKEAWSSVVGGMILNHGAVEFVSLQWILHLSKSATLRDVAIDLSFSKRIAIIKSLVARTEWSKERRLLANDIWQQASGLSQKRNQVVHNPICTRVALDGKIEIGILESKKMKGDGTLFLMPITIHDVADTGKRLAHLLGLLQEFFRWMENQGHKT